MHKPYRRSQIRGERQGLSGNPESMAWSVGAYACPYCDTVFWTVVLLSDSEKTRSIVHQMLSLSAVRLRPPEPVFKIDIWHAQSKT